MESSTGSPFSLRPVYFFREHEHPHGFLSQWTHAPFTAPSPDSTATFMTFSTTEQYMMYHKAVLFKDPETAKQILLAHTPKQQKALGRKVKNFDEETWNAHREKIVEDGNWNKFSNSKDGTKLKDILVETGDRELVEVGSLNAVDSIADPELEASPFDRIWGIGYSADIADEFRDMWGENLLGKVLMRVRDRINAKRRVSQ